MLKNIFNARTPAHKGTASDKLQPTINRYFKENQSTLKIFALLRLCVWTIIFSSFFPACVPREEVKPKPISKVTTFFGTTEKIGEPFGIAVKTDEIYVSDGDTGRILKISKNGNSSVLTDKLDTPSQIAFDKNGDLIVADAGTHTIKKIKPTGEIELVAGTENQPGFADGDAKTALFYAPVGVAVLAEKILVADTYNDKIRVIENGRVTTLAGSSQGFADGAGAQAKFDTPGGIAITPDGKIIVADMNNHRLRMVESNGATRTLAGTGNVDSGDGGLNETSIFQPTAVSIARTGVIYFTDGNAIRAIDNQASPLIRTVSSERRGFQDGNLSEARFNRPSGLALDEKGNLFVADSENQTIRAFTGEEIGKIMTAEEIEKLRVKAEDFRQVAAPRWSYNPPDARREIAGTLGEIRGEMVEGNEDVWFHNGLDVVGGYGETARIIRAEKVLRPVAAENFATLRELVRMPTLGYIHLRLGRDSNDKFFDDKRFLFSKDENGKTNGVRIPRGTKFQAGDAIGTLNAMNHVHLIAGRSGAEMNALDALAFPNISDAIVPVIEKVSLFDENWKEIETSKTNPRITVSGKTRIVAKAFDRMDGNAERRRLGVFQVGYQILKDGTIPVTDQKWTIRFDRLPDPEAVRLVYARGSKSGATGETIFNYIATNQVHGTVATEDFFDAAQLENGNYVVRVFAADYFGNTASKDLEITITK
jgi:DNA-binding beta-propeller fold protein YncE